MGMVERSNGRVNGRLCSVGAVRRMFLEEAGVGPLVCEKRWLAVNHKFQDAGSIEKRTSTTKAQNTTQVR